MNAELLERMAYAKRNPEFATELSELDRAYKHANGMLKSKKLSQREFQDFESHLWSKLLEALPVEEFTEMMKDGRLANLEALARRDDTDRDGYGVEQDRKAAERKIKADALDNAWLDRKIDSKTFAEMNRVHVGSNERLNNRLADGDHDGVASEMFAARHDGPADHSNKLTDYLKSKYGDKAPAPKTAEPSKSPSTPERVAMPADYDADAGPPVADADGIIDWDAQ